MHVLTSQCCSECVETCTPINLVSCFLLLRLRLDVDVLVLVECLVTCSCVPISTFSLIGSSGGAFGHGERFDGTVTSRGGSIIHLHEIVSNIQVYAEKHMLINTILIHPKKKAVLNSLAFEESLTNEQ